MDAKTLSNNGYTLFNVNDKKLPSYNGYGIREWSTMSHNDLKKRINFDKKMFGMRMGEQGNKKHILSLDFDCCKKIKGNYVTCKETDELLNAYFYLGDGNRHGMFTSSTKGNCNVLVDYSNCPNLKKTLLDLKTCKINKTGCGLEILIGGQQVIPPSMTKCKISNEFERERKFESEEPFKVLLDDDDDVCGFILDYVKSSKKVEKPKIKQDVKTNLKKKETNKSISSTENETLEKICDLIDIQYLDERKDWLTIILAMKKCGLSIDFAKLISKKSDKYDEVSFEADWDSYNESQITSTEGTLRHYAKESNEAEYEALTKKDDSDDVVMNLNTFYNLKSDLEMPEELVKELEMYSKLNKTEQTLIDVKKREFDNKCFEDELKKKLEYFEAFHFKVMNPACFGRTSYNKTVLVNASELELQYENIFVGEDIQEKTKWTKIWRSLKYIRTFENVDFLPHPLPCPDYTLNTFNGLRAAKLPSCVEKNIDLLLNHIKILSGNDEAGTKYIIDYLAHAVQKPGELPRVALVFQSDQGTGKNIFFENFVRKVLGGEYLLQTAEMDKVIGRFSMINNKLFVIMDETSGKDSFSNSDKIKNIITAEQVAWERKGIDGININNCGRYLFFSNNETPVKIESSDRRYVVYKCSNDRQNDSVYFKKMSKMFNDDEVIKTFYSYLLNIDISNWDSINDRPITEAYQDIQSANTPAMAKWLEERYYELNHLIEMESDEDVLEEHKIISSKTLYIIYTGWLNENGFKKMEYNTTKFGREIAKYDGISKKRNKSGIVYVIDYEVLKTFMIRKKYMECIVEE